jgi:hypothetical protein
MRFSFDALVTGVGFIGTGIFLLAFICVGFLAPIKIVECLRKRYKQKRTNYYE